MVMNGVLDPTRAYYDSIRVSVVPWDMVRIPGGTNEVTDPDFGSYSLTADSFYMDRYEVTKAKWDAVANWAEDHGYDIGPGDGGGKAADHPVCGVNWYECVKWCNARSEMEGRRPAYYADSAKSAVYRNGEIDIDDDRVDWGNGYRLPTDEEWEYAARGGTSSNRFPWSGDTIGHSRANYYSYRVGGAPYYAYDVSPTAGHHPDYSHGGYPYTSPPGRFAPNACGLHDMAGNVWEWCWDCFWRYDGAGRVLRGGGWGNPAADCRLGNRAGGTPGHGNFGMGFRTVLPSGPHVPAVSSTRGTLAEE
jgi:formylglycine-generating enzyme required for sulfatase activity